MPWYEAWCACRTCGRGACCADAVAACCVQPFTAPLPLQVSFLTSPTVGYALPLRLPIMAPHFITAASLPFEAFGQRWLALEGNVRVWHCATRPLVRLLAAARALTCRVST